MKKSPAHVNFVFPSHVFTVPVLKVESLELYVDEYLRQGVEFFIGHIAKSGGLNGWDLHNEIQRLNRKHLLLVKHR